MGVKNQKGGNKAKKQGRKHVAVPTIRRVRFSEDSAEIYACCEKMLGNGMCLVKCIDSKSRMCIIRKKFRGRHKTDNKITIGTWLLIGSRDYESTADGKMEKCDLLEVYKDNEKEQLKQHEPDKMWKLFNGIGISSETNLPTEENEDIGIIFKSNDIDPSFLDNLNIDNIDNSSNTLLGDDCFADEIDIDDI